MKNYKPDYTSYYYCIDNGFSYDTGHDIIKHHKSVVPAVVIIQACRGFERMIKDKFDIIAKGYLNVLFSDSNDGYVENIMLFLRLDETNILLTRAYRDDRCIEREDKNYLHMELGVLSCDCFQHIEREYLIETFKQKRPMNELNDVITDIVEFDKL